MQLLALIFGSVTAWVGSALIARLLLSLGVGFVTYVGVDTLLSSAESAIGSLLGSVPPQMVEVLGTMRVDDSIKVVLSALTIRVTLTTLKKLTFGMVSTP